MNINEPTGHPCRNFAAEDADSAKQEKLINDGMFDAAKKMDIDDVQSLFGDKYNDAIDQMKNYTDSIPEDQKNPNATK
jgi:hypothetical protein